jgi:hypothetical protein
MNVARTLHFYLQGCSGGSEGRNSVRITGINEAHYPKKVVGGHLAENNFAYKKTRHSPVCTLALNNQIP